MVIEKTDNYEIHPHKMSETNFIILEPALPSHLADESCAGWPDFSSDCPKIRKHKNKEW